MPSVSTVKLRSAPVCQTPVTAVSMLGEPWMAVRCMWCITERMPPSSSPPPARPGPPWTRCGTGEPWPVEVRASSRLSIRTRPWWAAMPGDQFARHGGIVGAHRGHERAAAAGGEADGVGKVLVPDHGGDRAERLQRVDLLRLGVVPAQDHRGHEGAAVHHACGAVRRGDRRRIERSVRQLTAGVEHGLHGGADVGELLHGGQRAHGDALGAGVAEHHALLDALADGGR